MKKNDDNCKVMSSGGNASPAMKSLFTFVPALLFAILSIVIVLTIFGPNVPDFVRDAKPFAKKRCCPCEDDNSSENSSLDTA